jgi:secreted Zn-dependent insulinase-like peptidase
MTLALSSRHSVENMENWVSTKFSPVVNKDVIVPDLGQPAPYTPDCLGKLVKFVPVKDRDMLTISWNLPYC